MFKVKLINKISPTGLAAFNKDNFEYSADIDNPDAFLVRSGDLHSAELPKTLKCIARAGAGTNNIPIDKCSENGIVVFNTPGANANAVKELAICALLLASRKISKGISWAETLKGKGDEVAALVEKGKNEFVGPELYGKTLGVVGLGAIGAMVANTALALGMEVVGYDPFISVDAAWSLSREVKKASDLKTIYESCDYISLHLPLNKDTKGMLNESVFAGIKKGIRIINFSRGDLIDNEDMAKALNDGTVACYVTDFPCEEVLAMKNVVAIPHLGASTPESEDNCAVMAVKQTADYLLNGNIVNSVNMPDAVMPRSGDHRICIINRNIPNMLNIVISEMANAGINIENMLNKSKGNYAYTIVDTNTEPAIEIINKLSEVKDFLKVRVIK